MYGVSCLIYGELSDVWWAVWLWFMDVDWMRRWLEGEVNYWMLLSIFFLIFSIVQVYLRSLWQFCQRLIFPHLVLAILILIVIFETKLHTRLSLSTVQESANPGVSTPKPSVRKYFFYFWPALLHGLFFLSFLNFILALPMHKCWEQHLCVS